MSEDDSVSRRAVLGVAALGLSAGMGGCGSILARGSGSGSGGESIEYGQTIDGTLQEGEGSDPEHDDLAEPVAFQGSSGDTVTIRMQSESFDTYLVLQAPDGTVVGENDDRNVDTYDSGLTITLDQSGEYVIWAGSFSGSATGSYSLSLERQATDDEQPGVAQIEYGGSLQETLQEGDGFDPRYGDLAEPVTFQGSAGDSVVITMRSDAFDPFVVLEDPNGATAEVADDGAGDYDTELRTTLSQTGEYVIWAGSLSGTETGPYELRLRSS